MKNRIKITESQLNRLKININEYMAHPKMVKKIKEELDMNYEVVSNFVREGGEYFEHPMIKIKVDEELITPKALYEYMKNKHKVNGEFIKQAIIDWVDGKITDDYRLSRNVPFS